jgi:hypothetical protein
MREIYKMEYFKKIDIGFEAKGVAAGDVDIVKYGIKREGKFEGIAYKNCIISHEMTASLLKQIPIPMRHQFVPLHMHINRDIIPHVDSGVCTVINLYIKSGGYTTDFNIPKDGAKKLKLDNQTDGYAYNFEDVDTLTSFVAEDGDAYILDVTKLHSVHSGTEKDRIAVALSTKLDFDSVCKMFSA